MYIDTYVVINFLMDFFALFLTAKIMNIPFNKLRLVLSSLSGTLFSVISLFLPVFVSKPAAIVFPALMSVVAFGNIKGRIIRISGLIFGISLLGGGTVTAIFYLLRSIMPEFRAGIFLIVFSAFVCLSFIRIYYSRLNIKLKSVDCRVDFSKSGKTYSLVGLIDSADYLTEKNSGLPVIIVSSGSGITFPADIEIDLTGATGEGTIYGFIPDDIRIKNGRRSKPVRAVIAVDCLRDSFAGYDCLVPLCVI